uniref:Uncharacterized protein n=1 Tax=Trichobilharzia regenti TaxID=157069 RepID=A0AA85J3D6_TRIRE|nr:unnamed protein product [Trichobilharzia regenti]
MSYLHRKYNFKEEITTLDKEKNPGYISSEITEFSDYTKEALALFKQKLSSYIEAVDKNLASAAEDSVHFDFSEKPTSMDSFRK